MGTMIKLAKEKNGFYFVKEPNGKNNTKGPIPLSLLFESSLSNKNRIWLYHFRLSHPSFSILKVMFLSLFKGFDLVQFHCDVFELEKHKCASLLISNTRASMSFTLIHSDVWGPSTVLSLGPVGLSHLLYTSVIGFSPKAKIRCQFHPFKIFSI